jgi:hypothetical protein
LAPAFACRNGQKFTIFALEAQRVLTKLCSYSNNIDIAKLKGGYDGNSLLYEVQEKGGDKKPHAGYTQEPKTSDPGCLSYLRHKSIQNRETLNFYGGHRVFKRGHALVLALFAFA